MKDRKMNKYDIEQIGIIVKDPIKIATFFIKVAVAHLAASIQLETKRNGLQII